MRSHLVALSATALMAIATPTMAQVGIGVAAGPSFPANANNSAYDRGVHEQVAINIAIPYTTLDFRIHALRDDFGGNQLAAKPRSLRITGVGPSVILGLGVVPLLGPYLIGGVTGYTLDRSATADSARASVRKVGGDLGVGFRSEIGRVGVFAESTYHFVRGSEGFQFIPLMFGVSF